MENEWRVIGESSSPDETFEAGRRLAAELGPGDVVLLSGDLGAGKTCLVQGAAAGLGASESPVSPTFNIVLTYGTGCLPIHHFDLYRLDSPGQLEDIGLREYLESDGVCFIEWAEKFPGAFGDCVEVAIEKLPGDRRLIRARGLEGRLQAGRAIPGRVREPVPGSGSQAAADPSSGPLVLAVDTSNEVVAIGVGALVADGRRVDVVATREIAAHRASNTTLVPAVDALLAELGVARSRIACVCVGRGPGSFTGVRIAMAAAKGIASALGVGLVGVSTLDAIAWNAWEAGVRGDVLVLADAMRKEVYPAWFELADAGARRLTADCVVKASDHAEQVRAGVRGGASQPGESPCGDDARIACGLQASGRYGEDVPDAYLIAGDALVKYRELYESTDGEAGADEGGRAAADEGAGERSVAVDGAAKRRDGAEGAGAGGSIVLPRELWEVTGRGILLALQAAWRAGAANPLDAARHAPAYALPVYTRLSDAEENERAKLARNDEKDLAMGVQGARGAQGRETMHSQAVLAAPAGADGVSYRPLDAACAADVAALEAAAMGTDAWNERMVASELGQRSRSWWVAEADGGLVGYAGGLVAGGELEILKVAVAAAWRRHGIARELVRRVAEDARNLGASACSLEVRASNAGAQALYDALGLEQVGTRPRYYSDGEDALIMRGPLPIEVASRGVAGMQLHHNGGSRLQTLPQRRDGACGLPPSQSNGDTRPHALSRQRDRACGRVSRPVILAIESSCDETAAAVVDGAGMLLSDVVASQIDFHARFGGVVPEIASRKHIEAICGVCEEALGVAGATWRDLDSVAVTYAPGLLGALVVGVAFAKGAAWALDVPLIRVNHLEGHLYANKLGDPGFEPPAVVSLVSGGNTMLVHMRGWGDYRVLGETIDDAVGEAFDKVAKALGLGYPGGPVISRTAAQGDPAAIAFPRAMLHSHDLRFSLSGLKTAVVNHINGERAAGREPNVPDIAASFQQAVVDVQVAKARDALEQTGAPVFCLGGGVAANPALREAYEEMCAETGVRLVMPPLASCGDNAGMIALAALDRYRAGRFSPLDSDAQAHADLGEPY